MISQLISSTVNITILTLSETISSFKLAYRCALDNRRAIDEICTYLSTISDRDSFELHIEAGGYLFKVNHLPLDLPELAEFCIDAEDMGEISVTLSITKNNVGTTISVYSLSAFETYLASDQLISVLSTLSSRLDDSLHFDVKDSSTVFNTQTISFGPGGFLNTINIPSRNLIVSNFKEGASFSGPNNFRLIPNDFHLRALSNRPALDRFFTLACGLLSLAYLANVSELGDEGKFSFRMYGYKAVSVDDIGADYLIENAPMLYKIYRWVYDTDTVADRLGLARNVISLHLDSNGLPALSQAVWDAIHSNYQIYLKGNIESYLEVKGKIAELLLEAISKTNQMAESLLDSLKNNALVIITFLLTVVVINGIKDLSVGAIFSIPYLIVVIFICVCSWVWMLLLRKDARDRFSAASLTVANVLRTNYGGVLLTTEIDRSVNPAIAENQAQLSKQIEKYSRWWQTMLGSFSILYVVGFVIYNLAVAEKKGPDKSNTVQDTKPQIQGEVLSSSFQKIPIRRIGPEL